MSQISESLRLCRSEGDQKGTVVRGDEEPWRWGGESCKQYSIWLGASAAGEDQECCNLWRRLWWWSKQLRARQVRVYEEAWEVEQKGENCRSLNGRRPGYWQRWRHYWVWETSRDGWCCVGGKKRTGWCYWCVHQRMIPRLFTLGEGRTVEFPMVMEKLWDLVEKESTRRPFRRSEREDGGRTVSSWPERFPPGDQVNLSALWWSSTSYWFPLSKSSWLLSGAFPCLFFGRWPTLFFFIHGNSRHLFLISCQSPSADKTLTVPGFPSADWPMPVFICHPWRYSVTTNLEMIFPVHDKVQKI